MSTDDDLPLFRNSEPTGRELAEKGMAEAVSHADRIEDDWSGRAFTALLHYAARHPLLTVEEVKAWAYERGLPEPPAGGAWGHVVRRAKRENIVVFDSHRESQNASRHCQPVKVWRSLISGRAA